MCIVYNHVDVKKRRVVYAVLCLKILEIIFVSGGVGLKPEWEDCNSYGTYCCEVSRNFQ